MLHNNKKMKLLEIFAVLYNAIWFVIGISKSFPYHVNCIFIFCHIIHSAFQYKYLYIKFDLKHEPMASCCFKKIQNIYPLFALGVSLGERRQGEHLRQHLNSYKSTMKLKQLLACYYIKSID